LLFTLYHLLRLGARLAAFPGSLWLWRKELEFQYCTEYSLSLKNVTSEVLAFLVTLPDPEGTTAPTLHLDKFDFEIFIEQLSTFKRQLESQLDTYVASKGRESTLK
jgi:hypothetical protein